jgi:hypothetical protein
MIALLTAAPLVLAVLVVLRASPRPRTDHYIANAAHGSILETRPPA